MPLPAAGLALLLGHAQAAHQLGQGEGLVVVPVTVLHELLHTLLGLGLLPQEPLEGLQLLLADVPAGVLVQQLEIPVDHSLLQRVAGVGLGEPGEAHRREGGRGAPRASLCPHPPPCASQALKPSPPGSAT